MTIGGLSARNISPVPKVQYKLVVFAGTVAMVALLPVLFLDSWLLDAINKKLGTMEPQSALVIQEVMVTFKGRLLLCYGASLIVTVVTSILGGLFLTQKMVGPVYKLTRYLERVAAGENPGPFTLRNHDDFRDSLEPAVNAAMERIK